MIHKRLKVLFLSAALLGLPALQARVVGEPFKWVPNAEDGGVVSEEDATLGYVVDERGTATLGDVISDNPPGGASTKFRSPRAAAKAKHAKLLRSAKPAKKMNAIKFRSGKIVRAISQDDQDAIAAIITAFEASTDITEAADIPAVIDDGETIDTSGYSNFIAMSVVGKLWDYYTNGAGADDTSITNGTTAAAAITKYIGTNLDAAFDTVTAVVAAAQAVDSADATVVLTPAFAAIPKAAGFARDVAQYVYDQVEAQVTDGIVTDGQGVKDAFAEFLDEPAPEATPAVSGDNASITAVASTDVGVNTLEIYGTLNGDLNPRTMTACSLKIDGDVTLTAKDADLMVKVMTDVVFEPYNATAGDSEGAGYSHLIFDVADGKKITFNVDHDVEFKGVGTGTDAKLDMFLTFKGRGQTKFMMANGVTVSFSGELDDSAGVDLLADDAIEKISNAGGGTKVFITMDQTADDVKACKNKVVFCRKDAGQALAEGVTPERTMVVVGYNSIITYVSNDVTGVAHVAAPDKGGFGSFAFDPAGPTGMGAEKARMILFLMGAMNFGWSDGIDGADNPAGETFKKIATRFPFNDASIVVAGNAVASYDDIPNTLSYSTPAGGQALFGVCCAAAPVAMRGGGASGASTLLVINNNQTHQSLASDPYWYGAPADAVAAEEGGTTKVRAPHKNFKHAMHRGHKAKAHKTRSHKHKARKTRGAAEDGALGYDWAYGADSGVEITEGDSINMRTGFVVGVNGRLDVAHNRALHHVAGAANRVSDIAAVDFNDLSILAKHNSSALVFDGLDATLTAKPDDTDPFIEYANTAAKAAVTLWGNGSVCVSCSASEDLGYIEKFWQKAIAGFQIGLDIAAANDNVTAAQVISDLATDFAEDDDVSGLAADMDAAIDDAWTDAQVLAAQSVIDAVNAALGDVEDLAALTAEEADALVVAAQGALDMYRLAAAAISPAAAAQFVADAANLAAGVTNADDEVVATKASVLDAAKAARDAVDVGATEASKKAVDAVVNAIEKANREDGADAASAAAAAQDRVDEADQVVSDPEGPEAALTPADILKDKAIDWDEVLSVARTKYDGTRLAGFKGSDEVTISVPAPTADDPDATEDVLLPKLSQVGNNVLEVQGPVAVISWPCPVGGVTYPATGTFGVESVAGYDAMGLMKGTTYHRYASPVVYVNDVLEIGTGATFAVNDATRAITGLPVEGESGSYPVIRGGERFVFNTAQYTGPAAAGQLGTDMRFRFPEVRLTGGNLQFNESANVAGVRIVGTDAHGSDMGAKSRITFGQHAADTGSGRMLQLGSLNNVMADDSSSDWMTQSAYINVFKQTDNGKKVRLAFDVSNPGAKQPGVHLVLCSIFSDDVDEDDKVLKTGSASNISVGWPTINGDMSGTSFPYANTLYGFDNEIDGTTGEVIGSNTLLAEVLSTQTFDAADQLATLAVDGGHVCFSAFDQDGKGVQAFAGSPTASGVVFVNHGGRLEAGEVRTDGKITSAGDLINDTVISLGVRGKIHIPNGQGFNTDNGSVRFDLPTALANPDAAGYAILPAANELSLNWGDRNPPVAVDAVRSPAKMLGAHLMTRSARAAGRQVRSSVSVSEAMDKPAVLAKVGPGTDMIQMLVSGATPADQFQLEVSGDADSRAYGRVREFATGAPVTQPGTVGRIGQGAHAQIFGILGGRFGLGTTNWNDKSSINPWNILGRDFVQVCPEGDCVVDVNSNLIVADDMAFMAVKSFGGASDWVQRLTFTSESEREIRVPSGVTLDLSSFGHGKSRQEICFGGKVKLVLEQGAAIRGPQLAAGQAGVVLYFNDEAQLVVESPSDRAAGNQEFGGTANAERVKIMGQMGIWLNKSACFEVGDGVLVGVQADATTPRTDVVLSLSRESQFNIGSANEAGGAFEVGNPAAVAGANINFTLATIHPDCLVHIDRQGFLGLGAGVTEKDGAMNGDPDHGGAKPAENPVMEDGKVKMSDAGTPTFRPGATAWLVKPLHNVGTVILDLRAGTFEHCNIADGSDTNAALVAVGSASAGTKYTVSINGPSLMSVKGGGNVMLVPAAPAGVRVNAWDYASMLPGGEQYGMFACGAVMSEAGSSENANPAGGGYTFMADSPAAMFNLLAMRDYSTSQTKLVNFAASKGMMRAGFVTMDANMTKYGVDQRIIGRRDVVALASGDAGAALEVGIVGVTSEDPVGPNAFAAR